MHQQSTSGESGLVLVDANLEPIALDHGAIGILLPCDLQPQNGDGELRRVPDELRDVIRKWRAGDQSAERIPVRLGTRHYRCRLYNILSVLPSLAPVVTAVHLDADSSTFDPVRQLARKHHLTDREEEALCGIALGLSTKELADRMAISPNTVKSFVRLIMIKLDVTSRAAIMVKLLEAVTPG